MNWTTRGKLLSQKSLNQLCFLVWRRQGKQLRQTALDIWLGYEMERCPWYQSTWWWKDSTSDWDVHMQTIPYPALKKMRKDWLLSVPICSSLQIAVHLSWQPPTSGMIGAICGQCGSVHARIGLRAFVHVCVFVFVKTDVSTSLRVSSLCLVVDSESCKDHGFDWLSVSSEEQELFVSSLSHRHMDGLLASRIDHRSGRHLRIHMTHTVVTPLESLI